MTKYLDYFIIFIMKLCTYIKNVHNTIDKIVLLCYSVLTIIECKDIEEEREPLILGRE